MTSVRYWEGKGRGMEGWRDDGIGVEGWGKGSWFEGWGSLGRTGENWQEGREAGGMRGWRGRFGERNRRNGVGVETLSGGAASDRFVSPQGNFSETGVCERFWCHLCRRGCTCGKRGKTIGRGFWWRGRGPPAWRQRRRLRCGRSALSTDLGIFLIETGFSGGDGGTSGVWLFFLFPWRTEGPGGRLCWLA